MNLRNDSDADSNHRFNACRFFESDPSILRNKFLSELQKKKLQDVAILLIVHPFGDSYSDSNDIDSDDDGPRIEEQDNEDER